MPCSNEASNRGARAALIINAVGSKWIKCYPSATKSAYDMVKALQDFAESEDNEPAL